MTDMARTTDMAVTSDTTATTIIGMQLSRVRVRGTATGGHTAMPTLQTGFDCCAEMEMPRLGDTWGFDRRGIWVERGCRGDFQLGR